MLDRRFIRENPEAVKKGMEAKGVRIDLAELLAIDKERRELLSEVEDLKHKRNTINGEISKMKASGEDIQPEIEKMKGMSQKIKQIDSRVADINSIEADLMLAIPNMPHKSVPIGADPKKNKIIREWGEIRSEKEFNFKLRDHLELAEALDWMSFEKGAEMAGRAFVLYKGRGAKLERALINFMLDLHTTKHKYTEVSPPFLVNRESMTGTGQLPKLEEDMYALKDEDFFLIPTGEVPVTNMMRNEILDEDALPVKMAAYTPCFRREAGSYGKDTRGLSRVHQFDKVEMVKFAHPDKSYDELESLLAEAEEVLQLLGLPYRVVLLCSGDLSFAASKCYDLEVWAPASKRWFEVSSCSNFEDFQARRINIKYRPENDGKPQHVHTLNGSGVALARTVIGIMENYQKEDGTVEIPEVLKKYM